MKNVSEKIILIFLNFIILFTNIIVGPSIKPIPIIFNIIIDLLTIIFMVVQIVKNKKILFINNKIDILFVLYFFTFFIPLLANKYVSFFDLYSTIQKNISLLFIYFLVKNLSVKHRNIIINIIIFSTIPIILIAYDRIFYSYIWNKISNFEIFNVVFKEEGILANFNYPNTLGIYLSSILIIIIDKIQDKNIMYQIYFLILFLLIILTKSKAVLILLSIFLIIYIILDKVKRKNIINLLIISILYSFINILILKLDNNLYKIILSVLNMILFTFFIIKKVNLVIYIKKYKKIEIILSIILFIYSCFYVAITYKYSKPLNIENDYVIEYKNTGNKNNYKIEIDLYTKVKDIYKTNGSIEVRTTYKNGETQRQVLDEFKNIQGKKIYNINAKKNVYIIKIFFRFKNLDDKNKIIINNVFINNKEFIINYKYLPNFTRKIFDIFTFKEKNVMHRMQFYKDSLIIINNNFWFGTGTNGWNYLYKNIQKYNYSTYEVHNNILNILINNGVIGLILYLVLLYYIIKYAIIKKEVLTLLLPLSIIFVHSLIDFDFSFLLVNFYCTILISLISSRNIEIKSDKKVFNYLYLLIIGIIFIINLLNLFGEYKYKKITDIKDSVAYYSSLLYYKNSKEIRYDYVESLIERKYENDIIQKELINYLSKEPYYNNYVIVEQLVNTVETSLEDGKLDNLDIINNTLKYNRNLNYSNYYILINSNAYVHLYTIYNKYYKITGNEKINEYKSIIYHLLKKCYDNYNSYEFDESNSYLNTNKSQIENIIKDNEGEA